MTYPVHVDEHNKGVPLARGILLPLEVRVYQLRGVRDEVVKVLVDGVDGKHRVPAYIGMAMFQTGPNGGHQRLQYFWFLFNRNNR